MFAYGILIALVIGQAQSVFFGNNNANTIVQGCVNQPGIANSEMCTPCPLLTVRQCIDARFLNGATSAFTRARDQGFSNETFTNGYFCTGAQANTCTGSTTLPTTATYTRTQLMCIRAMCSATLNLYYRANTNTPIQLTSVTPFPALG